MNIIQNNIFLNQPQRTPEKVRDERYERNTDSGNVTGVNGFQQLLENKIFDNKEIQFSKHAQMRLSSRDIELTGEQLQRVETGITKASAKGIKDSLVMVDDVALVVNIKNKVVVTALMKNSENVFTNIDGAVIV